jgi:MarR family transcriptional regulator for hemolysin
MMSEYKFEGNFLYYVRQIKRLYENSLSKAAAELGLNVSEADALCFLRENKEFDTARDIALYRDVSRAYVSKAIEGLVAKGLIEIRVDKDDRRLQRLTIAQKATEKAEALHKTQFEFYASVMQDLSRDEIKTLLALITKCAGGLEKASKN